MQPFKYPVELGPLSTVFRRREQNYCGNGDIERRMGAVKQGSAGSIARSLSAESAGTTPWWTTDRQHLRDVGNATLPTRWLLMMLD